MLFVLFLAIIVGSFLQWVINKLLIYNDKNKHFISNKITEKIFINAIMIIIYFVTYLNYGFTLEFFKYIILFSSLVLISVIDFRTQNVYDITVVVPFIFGIIFLFVDYLLGYPIKEKIFGFLLVLFVVGVIIVITRGIGVGDLEIFAVISLYVGLKETLLILFLSVLICGTLVTFLLLINKKGRKDYIAFVPYISMATFITIFLGNDILNWYLRVII